jgi:hypothetical protein
MQPVSTTPHAKQLSRTQLLASFDCDFGISESGQVTVAPEWQKAWLVSVSLPIPTGITRRLLLHKRAAPVFEAWFRMWTPEVCKTIKTMDGSFVPRLMRMAKNLPAPAAGDSYTKTWGSYVSRHTRGIAADFNASNNRQGTAGDGSLDQVLALARTVRVELKDSFGKPWTAGLVCGADWQPMGVKDPMHVEVGCWSE